MDPRRLPRRGPRRRLQRLRLQRPRGAPGPRAEPHLRRRLPRRPNPYPVDDPARADRLHRLRRLRPGPHIHRRRPPRNQRPQAPPHRRLRPRLPRRPKPRRRRLLRRREDGRRPASQRNDPSPGGGLPPARLPPRRERPRPPAHLLRPRTVQTPQPQTEEVTLLHPRPLLPRGGTHPHPLRLPPRPHRRRTLPPPPQAPLLPLQTPHVEQIRRQ
mmetsp:Transcript_32820/g.104674  ORF Transcript_32820/g.104674 Transcript_32820/m.104674 type:complete len:214 (-) Transcript_32820:149-790(-)